MLLPNSLTIIFLLFGVATLAVTDTLTHADISDKIASAMDEIVRSVEGDIGDGELPRNTTSVSSLSGEFGAPSLFTVKTYDSGSCINSVVALALDLNSCRPLNPKCTIYGVITGSTVEEEVLVSVVKTYSNQDCSLPTSTNYVSPLITATNYCQNNVQVISNRFSMSMRLIKALSFSFSFSFSFSLGAQASVSNAAFDNASFPAGGMLAFNYKTTNLCSLNKGMHIHVRRFTLLLYLT